MKVLLTVLLSLGLIIAGVLLLMFSNCAFSRSSSAGVRANYGLLALVDLVVIAAGVWAIGRLNRKRNE